MLGLYVSDHPLRGLEHVVEELSSHPISSLMEEGAPSSVTVAGILTGIQKKFTKKGEAYVVGSLADLQGGIDVIFFPSTYQQAVELLAEDALLCVAGRLDNGDPPKIIAMDVRRPDVTPDGDRPVLISCAPQQCTPDRVGELRSLLAEYPGSAPVHLSLESAGSPPTTLKLDDGLSVTRSPALVAELKRLFGLTAVR
jgi:DNA polymerase-3 subunit alpha